jgi:hypothetical protein
MGWDEATILVGGIATLGIYTFLIKENPLYRFFEHLFIGIATGFVPVLTIQNFLWPNILSPLLGFDVVVYPDGSIVKGYQFSYLAYLVPMAFGSLYYTIFSARFSWLSKLVIGFSLGAAAGMSFKGFFAEMIPQLLSSFKPLVVFSGSSLNILASLSNMVFVATLLVVMWYFFFTIRFEGSSARVVNTSGRWLMMVCFGAFFGSTVMARMALLVERVGFMTIEWWGVVLKLLGG